MEAQTKTLSVGCLMYQKQKINNKFWIDSLSAFKEYCRYRPALVSKVVCNPKMETKLRSLLKKHNIGVELNIEEDITFKAQVRFEYLMEFEGVQSIADSGTSLVLILDHITDTRNLGAIARTAAFLGVKHIIVPDKRQAPVNDTTFTTAQGAFAALDLIKVVNISRVLKTLQKEGYWVLGADMVGENIGAIKGVYDKVALVLGAEDKGISQQVRKQCDRMVKIDGADSSIDSLNVSVAAGILMHSIVTSN